MQFWLLAISENVSNPVLDYNVYFIFKTIPPADLSNRTKGGILAPLPALLMGLELHKGSLAFSRHTKISCGIPATSDSWASSQLEFQLCVWMVVESLQTI